MCTHSKDHSLACPKCGLRIPYAFLKLPCVFVSFYGLRTAGKSHILAKMTQVFKNIVKDLNYEFNDILDRLGGNHINILLQTFQGSLNSRNGEPIQALQHTERDLKSYILGKDECNHPKPFIYELKKVTPEDTQKNAQEKKDAEKKKELISHPYNERKINALKRYDLQRGIYLVFQDMMGEDCSRDANHHEYIKSIHTEGQIRLIVYDPHSSPKFVEWHDKKHSEKKWAQSSGSEAPQPPTEDQKDNSPDDKNKKAQREFLQNVAKFIGNETIWNMFDDNKNNSDTLILVSKFDEWKHDFKDYVEAQGKETVAPYIFDEEFTSGHIPSMEAVEYFSEKLRKFLEKEIQDAEFTNGAGNALFVPISAMGCEAKKNKFQECKPIWIEVPMIWILKILENRAEVGRR